MKRNKNGKPGEKSKGRGNNSDRKGKKNGAKKGGARKKHKVKGGKGKGVKGGVGMGGLNTPSDDEECE